MMQTIKEILMERDGMTAKEAMETVKDMRQQVLRTIA